ncbi:MAG: prolyl oligopeptidase family serine peptidase [Bacteroidota bacterium]
MKKQVLSFLLLTLLSAGILAQDPESIDGIWLGTLKIQSLELRLAFTLSGSADGELKALMKSIDQGGVEVPMEEVLLKNDTLLVRHSGAGIEVEGRINPVQLVWETEFRQGPVKAPITFLKVEQLPGMVRTQDPVPPFPYRVEEVSFRNQEADINLAGTLTIPEGDGPFPAVILLTGSGPQNRDEELFGHKPFLVLADYLSRNGIAVLRADDRGVGGSTGSFAGSTTGDFATDALAGVNYLKTREEIYTERIGLAGHSEGGMMASIAASSSADVGFIILMAAPGVPFEEIILYQKKRKWKQAGISEGDMALLMRWHNEVWSLVSGPLSNEKVQDKIRILYSELTEDEKTRLQKSEELLEAEIKVVTDPWWRYAARYKAAKTLGKVSCPVLAINGSKDTQVTANENLAAIKEALQSGGNNNYQVKDLEGLNHLFQTAGTGDESEYMKIEETVSPVAMEIISSWINDLYTDQ